MPDATRAKLGRYLVSHRDISHGSLLSSLRAGEAWAAKPAQGEHRRYMTQAHDRLRGELEMVFVLAVILGVWVLQFYTDPAMADSPISPVSPLRVWLPYVSGGEDKPPPVRPTPTMTPTPTSTPVPTPRN